MGFTKDALSTENVFFYQSSSKEKYFGFPQDSDDGGIAAINFSSLHS